MSRPEHVDMNHSLPRLLICMSLWLGVAVPVFGQTTIDWELLGEVNYKRMVQLGSGMTFMKPLYPSKVKKLAGEQVIIQGYILPLDAEGHTYALSRFPYAACFFCGGAGLESVMGIWFAQIDTRYRLDQVLTLRGTLRLNDQGDGLIYYLEQAQEVSR